jgi:hypothetical protein
VGAHRLNLNGLDVQRELLCKNHGQAGQNPTLDRRKAILILEKLNNNPKHCPSLASQAKTARAISVVHG